jgi:3-hydroxybutyryl-CoA dehydratase
MRNGPGKELELGSDGSLARRSHNQSPIGEFANPSWSARERTVLTPCWRRSECGRTRWLDPTAFIRFRSLNKRVRRNLKNVTRHPWSIWSFDDLVVGDEWESPRRTITESDVVLFAGLSGDFNPLHVDQSSAKNNPFGRPVAHGLLGLAISTGLTSHAPRVDTLALLAILEWRFHRPIFFGDTIHALSKVEALHPHTNGHRGVVIWHRRILNQDDLLVQEGRTQTLVRSRSRGGSVDPPQTQHIDTPP